MRPAARTLVFAAAWSAPAAAALPAGNSLRIAVVMISVLLFPGLPLALRLPPRPHTLESSSWGRPLQVAVLTGAVSLASAILVSELLLLAGVLTSLRVLVVLALVSTVAVLLPAAQ
ncbi:hypothetical protein ACQEVG_32370 [Streptomyces sp. CA-135486]|uniref:hypothetical protein n=1 Tax=Streptomyces sp. CA-135486 TaxID=3240049 RepID=UPI003D8F8391